MTSSHVPPFASLRCVPVVPLSRLPLPFDFRDSWSEFVKILPNGRMNILATDGHHLYLGYSRSSVAVYAISRACGVQLVPVFAAPVEPPTMINNIRVADFPVDLGGSCLLMTGGHENETEPASLSVLRIPPPMLIAMNDTEALCRFWVENKPKACTILLPMFSAWGLTVHEPTGRFAVSNLSDGDTLPVTLSLRARTIDNTHWANIPALGFSSCGDLLASGSLDHSFALHDVKAGTFASGQVLYQSDELAENGEEDWEEEYVWCVHWVGERAVCQVPRDDDVWLETDLQKLRVRQGGKEREGLQYSTLSRKSIFSGMAERHVGTVDYRDGAVPYDDCLEPKPGIDAAGARQWYHDQLREHRVSAADSFSCSGREKPGEDEGAGRGAKRDLAQCQEEEEWRARRTKRQTWRRAHSDSDVGLNNGADLNEVEEERERLIVVGRQIMLYLYRVTGEKPGKTSKPFVEQLQSLQIHPPIQRYWNAAFLDCLEITQLSALVVVTRGLGVYVLRLLRADEHKGGESPKLVMEREFPQRVDDAEAWSYRRDKTSALGVCVVPRGEEGSVTECYEIWIVWRDGMVEAWELSRGEVAIDPSVVV